MVVFVPLHRALRGDGLGPSRSRRHGRSLGASAAVGKEAGAEEWRVAASFGTPPQAASLVVDTGSSDLWVGAAPAGPFERGASATYVPDGAGWEVQYGSGGVSGVVARDTFRIDAASGGGGDVGGVTLEVARMAFGEANEAWAGQRSNPLPGVDGDAASDLLMATSRGGTTGASGSTGASGAALLLRRGGVLGLAFRQLNSVHRDRSATVLDRLWDAGLLGWPKEGTTRKGAAKGASHRGLAGGGGGVSGVGASGGGGGLGGGFKGFALHLASSAGAPSFLWLGPGAFAPGSFAPSDTGSSGMDAGDGVVTGDSSKSDGSGIGSDDGGGGSGSGIGSNGGVGPGGYGYLLAEPLAFAAVKGGGFWMVDVPAVRLVASSLSSSNVSPSSSKSRTPSVLWSSVDMLDRGLDARLADSVALVDSGSSFLGVPLVAWPALAAALTRGQDCSRAESPGGGGSVVCACGNFGAFPSLEIDLHAAPDQSNASATTVGAAATVAAATAAAATAAAAAGVSAPSPSVAVGTAAAVAARVVTLRFDPADYLEPLAASHHRPLADQLADRGLERGLARDGPHCLVALRPLGSPDPLEPPAWVLGTTVLKA